MSERDLIGHTFGGFVLLERIGQGNYGDVYRAEHEDIERQVVLKVLSDRRSQNETARKRFMREAKLASLLDHDYAVHVYAFGEAAGVAGGDGPVLWIAMELVEGVTLDEQLRTSGPMAPDKFMQYFEALVQVVHAAHQRGVVHRDLKPDNMMVVERLGRLVPKLLDFGSACVDPDVEFRLPDARAVVTRTKQPASNDAAAVDTKRLRIKPPAHSKRTPTDPPAERRSFERRITRNGDPVGSTMYMAPEQWDRAKTATPASDLYSLAVIAYEALTGRVPFPGNDDDDQHPRYSRDEVPELGAGFSSEADRVFRRALASSPFDRYRSALDLAAELGAALKVGERARLLSAAKHWEAKDQAPGLLWGADVLSNFKQLASQDGAAPLSELECSFIANSERQARRLAWTKRTVISALVLGAVGGTAGFFYLRAERRAEVAEEHTRAAQKLAEEQARATAAATTGPSTQGDSDDRSQAGSEPRRSEIQE